jgi:hypothetical protein
VSLSNTDHQAFLWHLVTSGHEPVSWQRSFENKLAPRLDQFAESTRKARAGCTIIVTLGYAGIDVLQQTGSQVWLVTGIAVWRWLSL